jgi:small subunit ribosomal protein S6
VNILADDNTSNGVEDTATDTTATTADATSDTTADDSTSSDTQTSGASASDTQDDASDFDVSSEDDDDSDDETSAQDGEPVGRIITPQPELNDALSQSASSQTADADAPRKDVPGGRSYEIIFIGRADDSDATEATTQRLRDMIESGDGAVDNVRTSETRRLAYTIDKQIEGVYIVVNARFTTEHIPEINRFFKLEESVLRHMILREEE